MRSAQEVLNAPGVQEGQDRDEEQNEIKEHGVILGALHDVLRWLFKAARRSRSRSRSQASARQRREG